MVCRLGAERRFEDLPGHGRDYAIGTHDYLSADFLYPISCKVSWETLTLLQHSLPDL